MSNRTVQFCACGEQVFNYKFIDGDTVGLCKECYKYAQEKK